MHLPHLGIQMKTLLGVCSRTLDKELQKYVHHQIQLDSHVFHWLLAQRILCIAPYRLGSHHFLQSPHQDVSVIFIELKSSI